MGSQNWLRKPTEAILRRKTKRRKSNLVNKQPHQLRFFGPCLQSFFVCYQLQIYGRCGTDRLTGPRTVGGAQRRIKGGLPEVRVLVVVQTNHNQRSPELWGVGL